MNWIFCNFLNLVLVCLVVLMGSPIVSAAPPNAKLPPSQTVSGSISQDQVRSAIAQLNGLAERVLRDTGIPGLAVAVVWKGETVYANGFGLRKTGAAEKVNVDTVFRLASLSKSVASSVVAQQVGKGLVTWQSPVVTYLSWFSLADPWVTKHVTIGDLFSHRSGLPDHAGDDLEDLGYGRRQILERLRLLPLEPFRAHYAYTNFGLTAAAEAVAQAAGTDWATLSKKSIYEPLGMSSTSSRFADYLARPNRAHGHILQSGRYVPTDQRQPDAQSPAGGVSASISDFARWMIMVLGQGRVGDREIVKGDALLQAITGRVVSAPSKKPDARAGLYGYGFGISTQPSGRVEQSHSGAFYLGAATNFRLLPSENLGIVAFSNATPNGAVEALTAQFLDLVQFNAITRDWLTAYKSLFASVAKPAGELAGKAPPKNPPPAEKLSNYTGTYENAYFGPARVQLKEGDLVLHLGPSGRAHDLKHWSGGTFSFPLLSENAPMGSLSAVTFHRDPADRVNSMTVELLNGNGLGTFTRQKN